MYLGTVYFYLEMSVRPAKGLKILTYMLLYFRETDHAYLDKNSLRSHIQIIACLLQYSVAKVTKESELSDPHLHRIKRLLVVFLELTFSSLVL